MATPHTHTHNTYPAPTPLTTAYTTAQSHVQHLYHHNDHPRSTTGGAASHIAMHRFLQQLRQYCHNLDHYASRWFRLTKDGGSPAAFDHARYMQRVLVPRLAALVERWEVATAGLDTREVMEMAGVEGWLAVVRADVEWFRREGLVKAWGERGDMARLGVCLLCGRYWVGMGV